MNSRHLVEPVLATLPGLDNQGQLDDNLIAMIREQEKVREASRYAARIFLPGVSVQDLHATGVGAEFAPPVLVYRPTHDAVRPAVLHIHGGGFIFGSAHDFDILNQHLCAVLDCVIVSVDYRRAPEAPYPAALDDCHTALLWTVANHSRFSIDPERIVVLGESAGGGRAAGLCLRMRDEGGPKIAGQVLVYPMLDDRTPNDADPHPFAGDFFWTRSHNRYAWNAYLSNCGENIPVYAAPARASDLTDLPPASIFIGALDLFVEENIEYVRRLTRAGVTTEFHLYQGAYHGFDMVAHAPATIAFGQDRLRALRRVLHPS